MRNVPWVKVSRTAEIAKREPTPVHEFAVFETACGGWGSGDQRHTCVGIFRPVDLSRATPRFRRGRLVPEFKKNCVYATGRFIANIRCAFRR
jgi:hypothetical protein